MDAILNFVDEYGIFAVIIAAIVYLATLIVKAILNKDKKKTDSEINLKTKELEAKLESEKDARTRAQYDETFKKYDVLLQTLVDKVNELGTIIHPVHTVEEQENDRKYSDFLMQQLDQALELGANRAYYFAMHNGGKDAMGRGLMKMSIIYERIDSETAPIMTKYQQIPRMLLHNLYVSLDDEDEVYDVNNIVNIKNVDTSTYYFLKDHGAQSALFRAVKSKDGLIVGIVAIEFNNVATTDQFEQSKRLIDKTSRAITGAMLTETQEFV